LGGDYSIYAHERKSDRSEREARGGGGGVYDPLPCEVLRFRWRPVTGDPSSQCYPPFFPFYANVQANVTYGMYYYITTQFDHAKHDSRLAAYEGVVLQRFEFIKVCMGMQRLCLKSQLFLYFVNKIYLPRCCVTVPV